MSSVFSVGVGPPRLARSGYVRFSMRGTAAFEDGGPGPVPGVEPADHEGGPARLRPGVSYSDTLGFDFSEVPARRKDLCDYYFFGGPTRMAPFPKEDWFTG
jgi:hypothetical protein